MAPPGAVFLPHRKMNITPDLLNPAPVALEGEVTTRNLFGKKRKQEFSIELKPLSLKVAVWLNEEFATNKDNDNGAEILMDRLQKNDLDATARLGFHLLKENTIFPDLATFKKFAFTTTGYRDVIIAVSKTMERGMPDTYQPEAPEGEKKSL